MRLYLIPARVWKFSSVLMHTYLVLLSWKLPFTEQLFAHVHFGDEIFTSAFVARAFTAVVGDAVILYLVTF